MILDPPVNSINPVHPAHPAAITGPNNFQGLNLEVPEPSASVLALVGLVAFILTGRSALYVASGSKRPHEKVVRRFSFTGERSQSIDGPQ